MTETDRLKKEAAIKAVSYIKSGMVLGLGTGSTANFAIEEIGRLLQTKELSDIYGIATSTATETKARAAGIPLVSLNEHPVIDLSIDGADEVDTELNLIKGGGGALLREKVIAQTSLFRIIVVDEFKLSNKLGTNWALPIEVLKFSIQSEILFLESIGGKPELRMKGDIVFTTDENNAIIDCNFGVIENPAALSTLLNSRAGIVEHGLFTGITDLLICASSAGISTRSIK